MQGQVVNMLIEELVAGLPDIRHLARMIVAMLLGAVVGVQRERIGKPARPWRGLAVQRGQRRRDGHGVGRRRLDSATIAGHP